MSDSTSTFKTFCGNLPHHIVTIVVIVLTLLFYGLQIALVFILFPVSPNAMIVAYASPAFYFPLFALGAIILGRFPGIWKILALFVNFAVAILNMGAYALLLYLCIANNSKVVKQTRVPWWAAYVIFGICFAIASIGSLLMGIDDCRWYIRYRAQQSKKNKDGKYSELPNPGDNDDEEL